MSMEVRGAGGPSAAVYPERAAAEEPNLNDPAAALLALMLQSRGAESAAAREGIDHATHLLEEARRQIQDAMKRAAEAENESGFWNELGQVFSGDIGALCEVVAAAAVIAATGGVGAAGVLAIAAATLSVSSDIAKHAGASPAVCAALSGAGALAGMAVGNVGGVTALWQAVATGAKDVAFAAGAAGIGATAASSEWHAAALDRGADATAARGKQSAALSDYDLALEQLDHAARDASRAETVAANIAQIENDGRTGLIARLGAA